MQIKGWNMFRLFKRQKTLKHHMKQLNWKNGNLYERVACWKEKLKLIQTKVDADPSNLKLKEEETVILKEY